MAVARFPRPNLTLKTTLDGSAVVVVPSDELGDPDWDTFAALLARLSKLGLTPAVNMTPATPSLLQTNLQVGAAHQAHQQCGSDFFAGVHVHDSDGEWFNIDRYRRQISVVTGLGGVPVIFPSHGLNALGDVEWVKAMEDLGRETDAFMIAELGDTVSKTPNLRTPDTNLHLLKNTACKGLVHASYSRPLEFDRIQAQGKMRSDFKLYTANERAIDMPMFGSAYMLLAASMVPDVFVRRDQMWADGDRDVYELNDLLQYLAMFTARSPIACQPHSTLQFLKLRGWVKSDRVPEDTPMRPESDTAVLKEIAERLGVLK